MKKFVFFIISLLLVLSLCGCGAEAPIGSTVTTPTAIAAEAVTPAITPSAISEATPIPSPSPAESWNGEVEGCTKKVENGKVLYYANEGNAYGLDAGELFGEFVEEVNIITGGGNGTDEVVNNTGGWVLNSKAVHYLLQQASAETGEDCTKTKVVLPVDIRDLNAGDEVNISSATYNYQGVDRFVGILLEFGESNLPILDGYDSREGKIRLRSSDPATVYFIKENGDVVGGDGEINLTIPDIVTYSSTGFSARGVAGEFSLGDKLMDIKSSVLIYNRNGEELNTKISDIFLFKNAPVFLMANGSF
jgi:hypothetical protein